jgi:hypothetical protein
MHIFFSPWVKSLPQSPSKKWELACGGQRDAGPDCVQPKFLAAVLFRFFRKTLGQYFAVFRG